MDENRKTVLRLDGSYGLGDLVAITILTADKVHGKIETTYEVPYAIVDTKVLTSAFESKYILGYKLERHALSQDCARQRASLPHSPQWHT